MSGICAVWRRENSARTADTVSAVSRGLCLDTSERIRTAMAGNSGVGVSARFATQQIYEDARLLIACDAQLYNAGDLSRYIDGGEALGGNAPPAALIGALYVRFGDDFVGHLQGSFSIVIWDRVDKKLLAAVDRFGVNRLVYLDDGKTLLVASRIDALMRSGEIDRSINPRAIANVLNFTVVLGPETIFTSVHRIPPGAMLLASERQTRIKTYWDMRYSAGANSSEARLSRELESLVQESVAVHCGNDNCEDIGAFLSGGTDSSTIVGLMTRVNARPVKAFSIGFEEDRFNELEYADIAAKCFGAKHYKYLVGPDDCFDALPKMVQCFDEPFGNSSAIPTYFCARLAAQHGVKTLLAGDGGDELFGGNERYLTEKIFDLYHRAPAALRAGIVEPALACLPRAGLLRRAHGYVRRAKMPGVERMLSFQFLSTHSAAEVFDPDFASALNGYSILDRPSEYYSSAPAHDHLDRILYMDVKITLGDSDLPKVTYMSELGGIQASFPFLDTAVAEFSGRIPARLKVKGFQKRYLFKRAFRDLLPAEIIKKKKHGFGIPVAGWLKSDRRFRELSHDLLFSNRALERGYFRRRFIEELFRKHAADESSYYGDTIWTFLVLELWHRQFVDEPAAIARCG